MAFDLDGGVAGATALCDKLSLTFGVWGGICGRSSLAFDALGLHVLKRVIGGLIVCHFVGWRLIGGEGVEFAIEIEIRVGGLEAEVVRKTAAQATIPNWVRFCGRTTSFHMI